MMKLLYLALPLAVAAMGFSVTEASAAGRVEKACLRADRAGSPALCNCIQQVADMTLSSSDQKRAAGFFNDPEEAQEIRASKKSSDNAFWARYRNFGDAAEAFCAR